MPALSKKDMLLLIDAMGKYGEMLINLGKVEAHAGSLEDLAKKASKLDMHKMVSELEKEPKIGAKMGAIFVKTMAISQMTDKPASELSPKEKIRTGETIKEISELFKEMVET
jgi:hypothetical protein